MKITHKLDGYEPDTRLVRRCPSATGIHTYYARGWHVLLGSISLGSFKAGPGEDDVVGERKAKAVAGEYWRRTRLYGECPLAAFLAMQRAGVVAKVIKPPGAKRKGGAWVAEKFCQPGGPKSGQTVSLPGTHRTAALAAAALLKWLKSRTPGSRRCTD